MGSWGRFESGSLKKKELMTAIPECQLSRISALVAERMGLHFPKERWPNLERGIKSALPEFELENAESFLEWLLSSTPQRSQIEILAKHLTIGETYFFRDKQLFRALETQILPELIRLRRKSGRYLRIWSAGCSSGEEPYSLAILLSRMIPDIADWNITILATDINTRLLRKGREGVYGQWSFRDIEPGVQEVYFHSRGKRFELHSRIRKMVTFSYLNLVEDTYPSLVNNSNALDIILCRNVLMYLVPEAMEKVVQKFHRSLSAGGCLIVNPTESSEHISSRFSTVRVSGTIVYRKGERQRAGQSIHATITTPEPTSRPAVNTVAAMPEVIPSTRVETVQQRVAHEVPVESRASKVDDENRKGIYREALKHYEEGFYRKAAEKAEELISRNPSDADCLGLLARIYANSGKLDKALESCEKAIAVEKLHAGNHYLMATILQELGRTDDAVVSFKTTLYLDTGFTLAYVALGNISRKVGRHKESIKYFENALSLLSSRRPEDILPESEGINAERLMEIIKTMQQA
jgi:chemotaxis protein methyltransferase CheR